MDSYEIGQLRNVALLGHHGSGKTTFGKTLVGLHEKTAGDVYLAGEKLPRRYKAADFRHYARHMQMIFQDPYASLNPSMQFHLTSLIKDEAEIRF
ncbi:MAG: ATP-binding cassette domain-containing protein [Proteobacteria bacterium]|nr:ATP-binding cassette domain-containing protein [Pseudomonadota bacterium]